MSKMQVYLHSDFENYSMNRARTRNASLIRGGSCEKVK